MPEALADEIETYRGTNGIPSFSEAVGKLLQKGLQFSESESAAIWDEKTNSARVSRSRRKQVAEEIIKDLGGIKVPPSINETKSESIFKLNKQRALIRTSLGAGFVGVSPNLLTEVDLIVAAFEVERDSGKFEVFQVSVDQWESHCSWSPRKDLWVENDGRPRVMTMGVRTLRDIGSNIRTIDLSDVVPPAKEQKRASDSDELKRKRGNLMTIDHLVQEVADLEEKIADLRWEVRRHERRLNEIIGKDLPHAMRGPDDTNEHKTAEGHVVSIQPVFSARIMTSRANEAVRWLRENGGQHLINETIVARFPGSAKKIAEKITRQLDAEDIEYSQREAVWPQKLSSWFASKGKGSKPPASAFHIYSGEKAVIEWDPPIHRDATIRVDRTPDFEELHSLLSIFNEARRELREKHFRTFNTVGEYGEWLAQQVLKGDLPKSSQKGFDLVTGTKNEKIHYQIKSRQVTSFNDSSEISQVSSSDFDRLLAIFFDDALRVTDAIQVAREALETYRKQSGTGYEKITKSKLLNISHELLTDQFRDFQDRYWSRRPI